MRVALVSPPADEPVRSPLLAFGYLAAALRASGHDVIVIDAAALHAEREPAEVARRVRALGADLVGVHLKTLGIQRAYALAEELAAHGLPLVAGGPHATVRSREPLAHGFRWVLEGEAELSLPELCDAMALGGDCSSVAGVVYRDRGLVRAGGARRFVRELDELPDPFGAWDVFDRSLYSPGGSGAPTGILSSRGCPARCTFCANNVTGRTFRFRSPRAVADEARTLRDDHAASAFSFFDDSFAVGRRRVADLCAALSEVGGLHWTCTAHPAHLDPDVLAQMHEAGCGGVDVGLESGDPSRLLAIGKGLTTERVLEVLEWAGALGMHTVVNIMLGWPSETEAELETTLAFMERASELAGGFNARGVLVPMPGTDIYDAHHERHGFTDWWLREPRLTYEPFPAAWSPEEVQRAYASDPALERNFFGHSSSHLALMAEVLRRKAEHTMRCLLGPRAQTGTQTEIAVPAAGAR